MNITGGLALALGALFSAYMFMPKKRVLSYSLDERGARRPVPLQPADLARRDRRQLRRLAAAGDPGAVRRKLHSRVPATILIAIGGFLASGGDALNRFGVTNYFEVGKFLAVLFLLAGFLVSIEAFRVIRIPFTSIVLSRRQSETIPVESDGALAATDAAG